MNLKNKPIGFFDSGIGGISVLREALKILSNENFIYFGDSKNAPYGIKKIDEVRKLSLAAVDFLIEKDVKAVVVACNTATSAAIDDLRNKYDNLPIIGIEPALKPAVELNNKGKIIIMATPMTLSETKFSNLMKNYDKLAEIQPMPCPGLVEMIENGIIDGEDVRSFLQEKFLPYTSNKIAAVVLGCTHYPFIKDVLSDILNNNVPIIDGSSGTVNQLKRQLEKFNLTNDICNEGKIDIYNSSNNPDIINLCYRLLKTS